MLVFGGVITVFETTIFRLAGIPRFPDFLLRFPAEKISVWLHHNQGQNRYDIPFYCLVSRDAHYGWYEFLLKLGSMISISQV